MLFRKSLSKCTSDNKPGSLIIFFINRNLTGQITAALLYSQRFCGGPGILLLDYWSRLVRTPDNIQIGFKIPECCSSRKAHGRLNAADASEPHYYNLSNEIQIITEVRFVSGQLNSNLDLQIMRIRLRVERAPESFVSCWSLLSEREREKAYRL